MQLSAKQISSASFYILLSGGIIAYFIASFLFSEKLQANNGLGWDGYKYASIAADLLNSASLDSYLMMRILPSTWVHVVFKLLAIEFTTANVIRAFECINLLSILTGTLLTKRLMEHFNIQPVLQLLGLFLLLINYAVLKFTVYYPVMTDAAGFALGALVLYFYVKQHTTNLWLATLIALFSWPAAGLTGLIMLLFPYKAIDTSSFNRLKYLPSGLAALYIASVGVYLIYIRNDDTNMAYTLTVSKTLAPISIFALALTAAWWASWLSSLPVFDLRRLKLIFTPLNWFAVLGLLLVFWVFKNLKDLPTPAYAQGFEVIRAHVIFGIVRPFITLVSHVNFYGVVWILLIIFHKSVQQNIGRLGLGFALAITFNMILFGVKSESRILMNLLPWLVLLLLMSINAFSFRLWMFLPALVFNIISSKLWLVIGDVSSTGTYPDGTMTFPFQYFFMNLGPWMSEQMWLLFCLVFISSLVVTFFFLYKVNFSRQSIVISKRFDSAS